MRSVIASGVVVIWVVAAIALCAFADDGDEVWIFEGPGAGRQLDVTYLDAEMKQALLTQMKERGFERVAVDIVLNDLELEDESDGDGADDAEEEASRKRLRADLETLLRNGGRFPEGYQPAESKPVDDLLRPAKPRDFAEGTGALLLKYLELKEDVRRAPIYESVLRALAKVLRDGASADPVFGWLELKFLDQDDGDVYQEILHTLSGWGDTFAGADIAFMTYTPLGEDQLAVRLGDVPADSIAARMGLTKGDAIVEVDGAPPTSAAIVEAERRIRAGGKLRMRIRRKEGQLELLEFEFEDEPGTPNSGDK